MNYRNMKDVHLRYKQETGNRPYYEDFYMVLFRRKGQWILDEENSNCEIKLDGRYFKIDMEKIDPEYLKWLEDLVEKLIKGKDERNQ